MKSIREKILDGYVFEKMFDLLEEGSKTKNLASIADDIFEEGTDVVEPILYKVLPKNKVDDVSDIVSDFSVLKTQELLDNVEYQVIELINGALEDASGM